MSYENPPVDHSVNVSRESVGVEFLRLLAGLGIVILIGAAVVYFASSALARLIPFSWEADLVGDRVIGLGLFDGDDASAEATTREAYVQTLVDRLSAKMDLPQGMRIRAHYADSEVPNAFATLGGHIVVTDGLYRRMPSENALALVIAHEIGHVRARDPVSNLGGTAVVAIVAALLTGDADGLVPRMTSLVTLGYSRHAETRADTQALAAVRAVYGHARGTDAVFKVLSEYKNGSILARQPTLFSTHPADAERIARMQAAADEDRNAPEPIPLPETAGK